MVSPISPGSSTLPTKTVAPQIGASAQKETGVPEEIRSIPVPTPEMSSALAAQVLGASYTSGVSLGGEKLDAFSPIAFLAYLRDHIAHSRFKDVPAVGQVLSELQETLEVESQLSGLQAQLTKKSWGERAALVAGYIAQKVQDMPQGKTMLLPGGWQGQQGETGHAMLYRITRISYTTFRFELYNTGAGLELHPQALMEDRLLYGQKIEHAVSVEKMTDPFFWREYYELYREPAKIGWPIEGNQLYHWLDKLVENFVEKAHETTLSFKEMGLRRPQRAGNCTFECLLAYLKIQLQDIAFEGKPVYQAVKLDLQLNTLDSYWEFLDKQGVSQPTPETALKTLRILGLLSKELQTVQYALAKEYKKRVKEGSHSLFLHKQIRAVQAKQQTVKFAKKECHRLLSAQKREALDLIETFPLKSPKCEPGEDIGDGFALPKLEDSSYVKKEEALLQFIFKLNTVKRGKRTGDQEDEIRDMTLGGCIDQLPDVEDAFWEKHGRKAFPELLKWFSERSYPTKQHTYLSEAYQQIKCLAILVRLAKLSRCPILSQFSLDRRLITELIPSQNAPLLMAPRIEEAQSLQKHIQYLIKNTEENGLFQEFCDPKKCKRLFLDLSDETPPKGSLVAVVNTLFNDPKIYKLFYRKGRSRQDMVKECLGTISKDFGYMQKWVYCLQSHFHAANVSCGLFDQPLWGSNKSEPDQLVFWYSKTQEKTDALHQSFLDVDFRFSEDQHSTYALPNRFLDWLQPISEREMHAQSRCDGIDVQFRLINSKDDPSLRIENLLELFATHQELLQREEYRKFFFITLFQVSLKDGKIPLEEFLKNHPDGITLLTRFIAQGVTVHKQDAEISSFFFHVGLACAEYEQKICQKKEIPFSVDTLIRCWQKNETEYMEWMRKLTETESELRSYGDDGEKQRRKKDEIDVQRLKCYRQQELLESYITRYGVLVGTQEVMEKIFSHVSSAVWRRKIDYPDWLRVWKPCLGEACKDHLDQMSDHLRNKFFSQFVFGSNGQNRKWKYAYPYAYSADGTWAIHLKDGTVHLQGQEIWSKSCEGCEALLAVQKDPIWQQIVPDPTQLHWMGRVVGGGERYTDEYRQSLIFRDQKTGAIYRASFKTTSKYAEGEKYAFRFYLLHNTHWEPVVSPSQVEDRGMWDRLGVDSATGWCLVFDGLRDVVKVKDSTGQDRYQWDSLGLQDLSNGYLAVDMQTEAAKERYRTWIAGDPKTQVWGKWEDVGGEEQFVPCAMVCPTWSKNFHIRPDGTVHGTGDWEGFQVFWEEHLPAIPGVFPALVLKHEKLGKRVVLPAGSMCSGKDLTEPMHLKPYQDVHAGYYEITLDKKGRLKPKTREEALYLANLFYHVHHPFAALRCLESSKSSDPYSPKEWALLQNLLDVTKDRQDIHSLSLHLKIVWLMHKSQELPVKRTLSHKLEKADTPTFSKILQKYLDQILHIPEKFALSEEELAYFQQVYPIQLPRFIEFRLSLNEAGSLGAEGSFTSECVGKLYKDTWDRDLLQGGGALPVRGSFEEIASHFLDFYAILIEGSEQQKKQLASWLSSVWALQNRRAYQKYDNRLILVSFLLRLAQKKEKLPPTETVQSWCKEKIHHKNFQKFLLDTLQVQLSEAAPVFVLPPSIQMVKVSPTSLRAGKLQPPLPPVTREKSRLSTRALKGLGTTALDPSLTRYFQTIAAPIEPKLPKLKIPPLLPDTEKSSDAYKQAFRTLERGVEKCRSVVKEKLWVVNKEDQTTLYQALVREKETCRNEFLTKKQQLLAKIRNPELSQRQLLLQDVEMAAQTKAKFHWADLLFLFAKSDANAYLKKQPYLTCEQAQSLYEETAKCLVEQVRLQRWEKALSCFTERGELSEKEKTEELRQLLSEERTNYPVERHPSILLFEALSEIQLRPDQITNLTKLGDTSKDTLLEAIMGSGKSEVLIPLFAQAVADGEHLAIAVIPKELQGTTGTRLERKLRDLFTQNSLQIDWEDVSLANLQAMQKRLEQAIERREVLRFYAEELQRFFLKETALRYDYQQHKSQTILSQLDCFTQIRKILKTKGVALVDEAHQQLHRKRECRIALDHPVSGFTDYCRVATDLQAILVENPEMRDRFIFPTSRKTGAKAVVFVPEIHQKEWRELLATAFVQKRYAGQEKKALAFLLAEPDNVPAFEGFSEKERKKLAFARGQIHQILPVTLSKKHREDYGCFPPKAKGDIPSLLAGPYRGLGRPVAGSSFASPDEVIAFTIQSYLIHGVSPQRMQIVVDTLRAEARRRSVVDNQELTVTDEYQQYLSIIGGQAALERFPFDEPINYQVLVEELQERPSDLLAFVEKQVLSHVEQYPKTAVVNGLSFVRLFKTVKVVSGTFHAYFTMHHRFQKNLILQPEIEAEAFTVLTKGEKPLVFTEKVEADVMLKKIFTTGNKRLRGLVDQGALFQEAPVEVAKKILEYTKKDEQIQRVIYFEGDELRVLERGAQAYVKYDPDRCPKETSVTFYDQVHATGTDIAQADDAELFVTVSDTTLYADVIQAAFRARKLQFGQRCRFLVPFALTSALKTFGLEPDAITAEEVLRHAKHMQAGMLQQENYKAVLEKLKECFVAKCQEWMDEDPDDAELLHEILRDSIMDPERLYGTSMDWEDPEKIFTDMQSNYIKKLGRYRPGEDISGIKAEMREIIELAFPKDQVRLVPDTVSSQNREGEWGEVQMEQHQEQVVEGQQEIVVQQTLQRETLQELQVQFVRGQSNESLGGVLFDPEKWAMQLDVSHLVSPQWKISQTPMADGNSPVYSARDLLFLSKKSWPFAIKELPKKLLFSLDVASGVTEETFFTGNSLAMKHILLVPDPKEPNQPYQIVLSKREAELWVRAFKKEEIALGSFAQACLFSPGLQAQFKMGRSACRKEAMDLAGLITGVSSPLSPFEENLVLTKWMMGEARIYQKRELDYLAKWFSKNATGSMQEIEKCFTQRLRHPWDIYEGSPLSRLFSDTTVKEKPADTSASLQVPHSSLPKTLPHSQPRPFLRILFAPILFPIFLISWSVRKLWKWLQKRYS